MKQPYPLAEMEILAQQVVSVLADSCERIVVAGSIRRRRPIVSDIELVVEPQFETALVGLFGDIPERVNLLDQRVAELLADGTFGLRLDVNGRAAVGSHYKRLTYQGRGLDLFSEDRPERWGSTLIIRTGSAEFNKHLVTKKPFGLMPTGMRLHGAALQRHLSGDVWHALPTPDEETFFRLVGLSFIPPEKREL